MTVVQPATTAAMTALKPTGPAPKIAMVLQAAGCRLQAVDDGACSGLDAAAQRAEQFQRHRGINLHHIGFGGYRVGGECRLAEKHAVHVTGLAVQRSAAVGSSTCEVACEE